MDLLKFCDESLGDLVNYWNTIGDPGSLTAALKRLEPTVEKLTTKEISKQLKISEPAISQRANKIALQLQEFV